MHKLTNLRLVLCGCIIVLLIYAIGCACVCVCVACAFCEGVKASDYIMSRCLCVSLLASVCACVSGPQVFDGSLDACQGTILT